MWLLKVYRGTGKIFSMFLEILMLTPTNIYKTQTITLHFIYDYYLISFFNTSAD